MSGVLGEIGSLLFTDARSIGGIIPDVVIRERHQDDLEATEHPVEMGSPITDHAFMRPVSVTIEAGWSNSGLPSLSGLLSGDIGEGRVRQIYDQMQALQSSLTLLTIVTGKRLYTNMVITSLDVTTDAASEYTLMLTANCRQIIIVQTQETTVAPQANQANPASTAGTVSRGAIQPIPSTVSVGGPA